MMVMELLSYVILNDLGTHSLFWSGPGSCSGNLSNTPKKGAVGTKSLFWSGLGSHSGHISITPINSAVAFVFCRAGVCQRMKVGHMHWGTTCIGPGL